MGMSFTIPFLARLAPLVQRLWRLGVVAVVCIALESCGWVNPSPPRSVVADALAQKVAQTQAALQQQLGPTEATALPQASGIHITEHHWITLQNQPTVQVEGTYHLKGGGLDWGKQRQTRPFSLYLRRAGENQWVVVDSSALSVGSDS